MPSYMLALRDDPATFARYSPEEMQRIIERYTAWRAGLAEAGRLQGGEKLADEGGRIMRDDGGRVTVTDGPYTETKEVLGGFFIIEAASYDEAVEISRECPHLEFGSIEIRQVDDVHGND